ncbi:hypothetical protein GCM10009759_08120 [Kitasatospora saccharophila]|uniref:Uncharacterized protein n=2 Tax=Kitasatospora saccharophila TaxID=407973 RepID=A0ABN2WA49_9ACTN
MPAPADRVAAADRGRPHPYTRSGGSAAGHRAATGGPNHYGPMDTHTGRTAERAGFRAADLLPDEAADAFAEALADALAAPSGTGPDPGTDVGTSTDADAGTGTGPDGPDGADDPGWDYEDVILRSVN